MFTQTGQQRCLRWCIFIALFGISNPLSNRTNTSRPVIICPSLQLVCGNSTCYDPFTQRCTNPGERIECIGVCEDHCYNPSIHQCLNGTICGLLEQLCTVTNSLHSFSGNDTSLNQCYDPIYQACLNNTLCYPYQACGGKCLPQDELCINNKTACKSRNQDSSSDFTSPLSTVQSCDGMCYDPSHEQCIQGTVQCINNNNCSGMCYNSSTHTCLNRTLCGVDEELCIVQYSSWGTQGDSQSVCYKSEHQACLNNTLCYRSKVCDRQCLRQDQLCINNKTRCNLRKRNWYYNYQPRWNVTESCNGICYDLSLEQCIHGTIQCISNNNCSGTCYNPSIYKCLNGTLCDLDANVCNVKYNEVGSYDPPSYQCYNPTYQACVNGALCQQSQLCDQRCLRENQLCINNKTACNSRNRNWYYNYQSRWNVTESCNGICYDLSLEQCTDSTIQCINENNCSGTCYNPSTHKCLNGTLCDLDADLCIVQYSSWGTQDYSQSLCYNPKHQVCLNQTLCYRSQVCDQRCLRDGQLCANNNTICNTSFGYNIRRPNQIQVCDGICYDTFIQQCIDGDIIIVSSTISPSLPEATTGTLVPSAHHSVWRDTFKINSYMLVTFFVVFFVIRQLWGRPSIKTEKSICLDPDRVLLMKSDHV